MTVDEGTGVWSRTFRTLLTVVAAVVVLIALSLVGGATQAIAPGFHVSDEVALGAAHPQILVVFSDDASQTWIQEITVGLHLASSSASDNAPAWFFEYLDAVRFQDPRHGDQFRAALREKYRDRRLDLIVAIGSNAIDMVTRSRDEIRLDAPVLLVTYGSVVPAATTLPNASSLVFEYGLVTALATLRAVFPDTTTVFVASGASAVEREREIEVGAQVRRMGLQFVDLDALSLASTVTKVAALPAHSILFVAGGQVDPQGNVIPSWQLCEKLAAAANRPAVMLGAQFLGCGIVGGLMRDYTKLGRIVGERAIAAALGSRSPSETVPLASIATVKFDGRQLERWRVDESRLPPGSIVLFRKPTLWQDHRNEVLLLSAGLLIQSLLVVVLLYERRKRQHAELHSRRSLALAAHVERRVAMTALTGSIAHELLQPLSSILHNAEVADRLVASDRATREDLREILRDIRNEDGRASQIVQRHRAMLKSHELEQRPVLMQMVVRESLALLAHDAMKRQVQIDAKLPATPCMVAGDQVMLQQVLVNLVINAMDAMATIPSASRRVVVRQEVAPEAVEISVRDWGPGLPAAIDGHVFEPFVTTKRDGIGIGLTITRSIIEAHRGTVSARNNADGGATFWFTLPRIVAA